MRAGIGSIVAGLMLAVGLAVAAQAAGTTAPLPPPDPTAANLTRPQIQERALRACLLLQARLMSRPAEELRAPCQCYARGTVRAMSNDDVAAFRATGYFNDVTREKALGFIDSCKLKRPS